MSARISRPLRSGRAKSSSTRSKVCSFRRASPSSPVSADSTLYPSNSSRVSSDSRMPASSSMIRIEPPLETSVRGRVKTAASDIDCLSHWKFQLERGALARLRVHADLACMLLNDSVRDRQSKARAARLAFTRNVLGGKERVINLVDMLRRNAGAAVTDVDLDAVSVGRADVQRATFARHGVFGVQEQVQEHLLQLSGVAMDQRQSRVQIGLHFHVRGLELMLQQRERFRDDLVQIDGAEFRGAGAREIQQVVDDFRSAECLARDFFQ